MIEEDIKLKTETIRRLCPISSLEFGKVLIAAGILPPLTIRGQISFDVDGPVKIEFECYADERLLKVDFARLADRESQMHLINREFLTGVPGGIGPVDRPPDGLLSKAANDGR